MTDIDKKIAELEELKARATPGPWDSWLGQIKDESADGFSIGECKETNDAMLIVAMRNALPELIVEIKSLKGALDIEEADHDNTADELTHVERERDAALVRAEKAEEAMLIDREITSGILNDLKERAEQAESTIAQLEEAANIWEARAERMQKERDYLARKLATPVTIDLLEGTISAGPVDADLEEYVQELLAEAQEAANAKAEEVAGA